MPRAGNPGQTVQPKHGAPAGAGATQQGGGCRGGGGRSESAPCVLAVSVGVSGHPRSCSWRWESQRQPSDAAAPWSLHPRLLELTRARTIQGFLGNKTSLPVIFPGVRLVFPVVAGGGRSCHQPAGCCQPSWVMPVQLAPGCPCDATVKPTAPRSSPAPCVGHRTERL